MNSGVELLSTKISAPRLRSPLVTRAALRTRLDQGLNGKLTLISAPAGFGKTTLVSAWLAERALAAAWVSLDENDDDPLRFWSYVIAACEPLAQGALTPGALLRASLQNPKQPLDLTLTQWINDLSASSERHVLVIEDYHLITSTQIHDSVAFLLDHLPATLHLIITTRTDPPLPLARLRVRGELCELHAPDLRFSSAETKTFVEQTIPFPVSAEAISQLEDHTEGWAAGLRLAALALQGRSDDSFLTTFDGSHRHVVDYLIGEVFARQPQPIQQFLLQTAFLSRLSADLCDAIMDSHSSAEMLDALERANLFLTTGDGHWFRYHALFAEAMQHYARRSLSDVQVRELYRRASGWYETHGLTQEAVEASLDAEDFERAAELIEGSIEPFEGDYEIMNLPRQIERLPEAVFNAHPDVCLIYAIAVLFSSDRRSPQTWTQVQKPLLQAEARYRAAGRMDKIGEIMAFRSLALWWQDDYAGAFANATEAAALLRDDQVQWRSVVAISLGMKAVFAGQLDLARRNVLEGERLSIQARNEYGKRAAMGIYGDVLIRQGELFQAEQVLKQMLAEAKDDLTDQVTALFGLARLAYQWNDLDKARRTLERALAIAEDLRDGEMIARLSILLAHVQIARGDLVQARRWLGKAEMMPQIGRWLLVAQELSAGRVRLALAAGETPLLHEVEWDETMHSLREYQAILKTRITQAHGDSAQALDLLDQCQPRGETRLEIEALILKALAHAQAGNLAQAKPALVRALLLAQPGDQRRLFLDEGAPLAALLQETLHRLSSDSLQAYVRRLLADFAREQSGDSALMVEPLSAQEKRVLGLLSSGLTNPEIAQELVVSINTVKTQVKSIYRKLNVSSRQQASAALHGVNVYVQ